MLNKAEMAILQDVVLLLTEAAERTGDVRVLRAIDLLAALASGEIR